MTPIELSAYIIAILMNASRLFVASEGIWSIIPAKYRWIPPFVVSVIPPAAKFFGGVKTSMDLTQAVIATLALVVPGAMSASHSQLAKANEGTAAK
jgi:hypothetical protein